MGSKEDMRLNAFQTKRLHVQDWQAELGHPQTRELIKCDLVQLITPEVVQYLPPSLALGTQSDPIERWIKDRQRGGRVFRIRRRDRNLFLGLVFVFSSGETAVSHIGYMFVQNAWGQGYASECVAGLVAALSGNGAMTLQGGVARDNAASARVLVKNGFCANEELSDNELEIFQIKIA